MGRKEEADFLASVDELLGPPPPSPKRVGPPAALVRRFRAALDGLDLPKGVRVVVDHQSPQRPGDTFVSLRIDADTIDTASRLVNRLEDLGTYHQEGH